MKPIAKTLFHIPALLAAAMLAVTPPALSDPMVSGCAAPSPATTSIPYDPFGVTVPWVKASIPGMDLYTALTTGLDEGTQKRLAEQANGSGTVLLFLVDVSSPTGFPKIVGEKDNGTTGKFVWPFTRFSGVVRKGDHRFYWVSIALAAGCWNVQGQINGSKTPTVPLPVPKPLP